MRFFWWRRLNRIAFVIFAGSIAAKEHNVGISGDML